MERTLRQLLAALEQSEAVERTAQAGGWLHALDPRAKLVGLGALLCAAALTRRLPVVLALFVIALALAISARISVSTLARRSWVTAFAFSSLLALPALFLTPGPAMARLPFFGWPITATGLRGASLLVARVATAATLSLLLVLTTPWPRLLQALRALGVPAVVVAIMEMTYRYIFLLVRAAVELLEAQRARTIGRFDGATGRRMIAASVGVLLGRSLQLSQEVHLAMLARGFRGEFPTLTPFALTGRDWLAMALLLGLALVAVWFGVLT